MAGFMDQQPSHRQEINDWYNLDERKRSIEPLRMFKEYVDKEKVAIAGFYFCAILNVIKCYSCNVETEKWYPDDNPFVKHWMLNPSCKHLNENVTCKSYAPKNMEFADRRYRMMSFANWPSSLPVNSKDMADAGFYYTGKGDSIRCYYCAIQLERWEPTDNPWIEHCYYNSKCEYLLSEIGFYNIQVEADRRQKNSALRQQQPTSNSNQESGPSVNMNVKSNLCEKCIREKKVECFVPCGHVLYCSQCVDRSMETCPKCKQTITRIVRLFLNNI